MTRHILSLANGWTAEFVEQGEFRMGAVGWNLQLHGPEQQTIGYFKTQIVLVNDEDGERARKAISLSEDGVYGYLSTDMDERWVIDFSRCMIAPHRTTIYHYHYAYDESISLSEQPAYKRVREYIRVIGWFIYLTFPLTRDEDFPKVWEEYLVIRRRQLDELYFRN
ncbi:hypothetical protein LGQ10_06000 [Pseudomonas sp. L5B5]|uniref:hypothetical protein n=1 Tax=Pseudomonas sp. L5B5 TaxID=2883205 RepID=UPI001CFA3EB6|nr:hypothetical protein [Pseudomonas sp. L5B5]UCZ85857.1 hypothetical protein LGQ10_06000 [Pseudomonas sp. L5B5]